jgi:prepilin-type N-terminal cleavage/methylation domain-containing protein/prepilin-type processing-associated H-X9-DG protein
MDGIPMEGSQLFSGGMASYPRPCLGCVERRFGFGQSCLTKDRAMKKSFTLIELLVVIAIIAVLVAILLPALGKAREKTRQVACQSNIRQLFIYVSLYMDNYNGVFTTEPAQWGLYGDHNFSAEEKLCRYLRLTNPQGYPRPFELNPTTGVAGKYLDIYRCPTAGGKYGQGGYGINGISTYYDKAVVASQRLWGNPAPGGRAAAIPNPNRCILWGEVMANSPTDNTWPENWGCMTSGGFFTDRHLGGFNAVHWDGSVKYYNLAEFYRWGDYWWMVRVFGAGLDN